MFFCSSGYTIIYQRGQMLRLWFAAPPRKPSKKGLVISAGCGTCCVQQTAGRKMLVSRWGQQASSLRGGLLTQSSPLPGLSGRASGAVGTNAHDDAALD